MNLSEILERVRSLKIVNRLTVNQRLAGEFKSAQRGQGMDFEQVRLYQPGDDIRLIDWNVSARMGQTYVKEFKQEQELNLLLLVDKSASGLFGEAQAQKMDVIHELAAILAFTAMRNQYRLGALAFTDHVEQFIKPGRGRRHMMQLLSAIIETAATSKGTDIGNALAFAANAQRQRALVVLISDMLDKTYKEDLKKLLARHELLVIRPYHPKEVPTAIPGLVPVSDLEYGRMRWSFGWNNKQSSLGRTYKARVEQAETLCKQLGIRYLPLDITDNFYPRLEAFLSDKPMS